MCLYIALKCEKVFDLLSVFQMPHNNIWLQETAKTVKFTSQGSRLDAQTRNNHGEWNCKIYFHSH